MKISPEKKAENKEILQRDRNLIRSAIDGDPDAFATLVSFYYKRVQALGCRFFQNSADTEDFIQEVFLKVFKKLSTFRGESSFATWLTRIAFTTALNARERTKTVDEIQDWMEFPSKIAGPEEQQIRSLTQDAVKEAIMELPEKYSVCLDLYFFHDMSYEEISSVTGFPVNTIKSHIFRAKKILRNRLKDFGSG